MACMPVTKRCGHDWSVAVAGSLMHNAAKTAKYARQTPTKLERDRPLSHTIYGFVKHRCNTSPCVFGSPPPPPHTCTCRYMYVHVAPENDRALFISRTTIVQRYVYRWLCSMNCTVLQSDMSRLAQRFVKPQKPMQSINRKSRFSSTVFYQVQS